MLNVFHLFFLFQIILLTIKLLIIELRLLLRLVDKTLNSNFIIFHLLLCFIFQTSILKLIISISAFLLFVQSNYAQFQLRGNLVDESKKPIEFASCYILKDSVILQNVFSDYQGIFLFSNLSKAKYNVIVRYLNIERKMEVDLISDTTFSIQMNMQTELEEVNISNKKPLIEKQIDRIIYNVENSISSIGLTAYDVIRKAPGVRVNNFSITITGKSSVFIYINELQLKLTGEELVTYLRSISAEDISKIEVITTPPSKYDAEGNSGIINIVMKQVLKKGYNSNLFSNFAQNSYSSIDGGYNLTYNKRKISLHTNINLTKMQYQMTESSIVDYPSNTWSSGSKFKIGFTNLEANVGVDYKINDKTKTGFSYQSQVSSVLDNGTTGIDIKQQSLLDSTLRTNVNSDIRFSFQTANAYIKRSLDTMGKVMSFNLDWLNFDKKDNRTLATKHYDSQNAYLNNSASDFNVTGNRVTNAYTGSLNFDLPFNKMVVTTGLKSSYLTNIVGFNYFNILNSTPIKDTLQSNEFDYYESIDAAYFDARKDINSWVIKAGVRAEYTNVKGKSVTLNQVNNYSYLKLFPTLFIQKEFNDHSLGFTYSRRINRPSFYHLNPFRFYNSPYAYQVGNTFLRPEFRNNFELSYSHSESLNFSLTYSKLANGIGNVANIDSTTFIQISTFQNCLKSDQIAFNVNYVFNKLSWWENYNEFTYYFASTTSSLSYTLSSLKGFGGYFETDNQFNLNKRKTFSSELNFWYSFLSVEGINRTKICYGLDFGFRYLLFQKRLKLAINVTDILKSDVYRMNRVSNGIQINTKDYYDSRQVRISISYKFGNDKIQKEEKDASNEELLKRAK